MTGREAPTPNDLIIKEALCSIMEKSRARTSGIVGQGSGSTSLL